MEYNQLSLTPVIQSSSQLYQTGHIQTSHVESFPSSVEYNQLPSAFASQNYKGYNNNRSHTQILFLHFLWEGISGHDIPPSSVGYSQVPVTAATQSYQPNHAVAVVVKILEAEYKRRSQLKPLLWESTIKLPLEDVYTRLKIVSRRKRDFQLQNDEVSMEGIFEENDDVVVLVEGSPGIGKTTFCLKIAYDWAKQQIPKGHSFPEFVVLLLLKCRDIDGDVMDAIVEQLLPERMDETVKKEFIDFIEGFHYQGKVLIILDGLDELPKKSESHVNQLLHKKILPFSYVLVTSRQERGIAVRQKVDFDILLQIQGFTEEDAFEYIRKHFRYAGPEHLARGERLITEIKENTFLHALPSNPLNLLLLCVVFEDYQGELPSFRTELYQIIIRCLLRRYCAKHKLEAPGDDQALEKQFEDSLLVLGELAWRCLLEGQFSFREEELAKFESKIKDLAARKLGLVFKEASVKRINPQHEYHFFHKTFQEYLAATYLACKLLKEELNVFVDLKFKFSEITVKYRQVFLFVSGILGKDASVLFKQIGETLAGEDWDWLKCSKEEATFFTESFSESQNAEQMAVTLCSFIPFPLTVEIGNFERRDETINAHILMVAEACSNFPQLQHPVHLTIEIVDADFLLNEGLKMVAKFLVSCPKLQTFSFHLSGLSLARTPVTNLFEGLSRNSTISSFTFRAASGISSDQAVIIGDSLVTNKTLTTVTFELLNECNEAWASALEEGLSADTPLTSIVLKIYGSLSANALGGLKKVLSNRSLASLTLIVYGEMQDSLATSVGKALGTESILKSLTLIMYGKVSYSGAIFLRRGFLENSALNSLEVKVFGELPNNWVTVVEKVLEAKKSKTSVAFHPNITGTISKEQVTGLCPGFKLQSLTLNLWGELSCTGAGTLCNLLITSSASCVTLNIHGKVTDNVAEFLVRYLKPCKTLSSLSINIWGELTRCGSSALQELECNVKYSVALNVCNVASDPWICKDLNDTINVSSALTSVFTEVEQNSARILSLNISNQDFFGLDWARNLGDGLAKSTSLTTLNLTFNNCKNLRVDWACGLGDGLVKNTSLTTLSLTFNNCSGLNEDCARDLSDGVAENTLLTTPSLSFNNCRDVSEDWTDGLDYGLVKNTSLTTLSLTINNCSDLSEDWARRLGDGLAKNTSLTTLSLTINSYGGLRLDWSRGLGSLGNNTSLTTLSVTFNSYSDLSEDWTHRLGDGLANNTSLTTLSLTFNNCSDLSGDELDGLGYGLANNASLTTLCLTFNNYNDLRQDLAHALDDGLAKNTSLTTLSLTLNNYSDLSGVLTVGLGDCLAKNTSLTTLSVTINNYGDLREDWPLDLGDSIGRSKSLTVVSVTVTTFIKVSEEWLCALCNSLAESDTITAMTFTFNDHSGTSEVLELDLRKLFADCKLSPSLNLTISSYGEAVVSYGDWTRGLGDGLAKNTSLTTLSLTFNNCSDPSGGWTRVLGDGLAKNTSLTTLSLTVNFCGDLSADWTYGLDDGLAKNTSLTTLSLTFNGCTDLDGDWIRSLGDGLGKNTSLITLSLTLSNYRDLGEDLGRYLGDGLAENTSLTTLSLTLNNYSNLSGYRVLVLSDGLAKNTSLTTLSLTLNNYSDLSKDWTRDLGDGLAENSSLTTLSLTLNNYSDLSGDWPPDLGDDLGRSKSLTVVNVTVTSTYIKVSEEWLCGLCNSLAESDKITALNLTVNDHSGTSDEVVALDLRKHFAGCKSSPSLNLTVSLYGEAVVS
ncbi:uncharacterized protein LOC110048568 [Orbicella faveolata]|uniref:uncharacterized protein LOC110048568 n=1 Tax=Orbicella faveolata TaxID=48498 RepID=UPI0009E5D77F|nr:uncharacterized protein LOC110048568 [Orbicella faveolata]